MHLKRVIFVRMVSFARGTTDTSRTERIGGQLFKKSVNLFFSADPGSRIT